MKSVFISRSLWFVSLSVMLVAVLSGCVVESSSPPTSPSVVATPTASPTPPASTTDAATTEVSATTPANPKNTQATPNAPIGDSKAGSSSAVTSQLQASASGDGYTLVLQFPAQRYPETAQHIIGALAKGKTNICTIDRKDEKLHRSESLAGIPTKTGEDRDEYPMAMCAEGGTGADVMYISPSDNRGAGSWVSQELKDYPDGTRVQFVIDEQGSWSLVKASGSVAQKPASSTSGSTSINPATPQSTSNTTPAPSRSPTNTSTTGVYYKNCTAVRAAGKAPLLADQPGYRKALDRDGDGVACE